MTDKIELLATVDAQKKELAALRAERDEMSAERDALLQSLERKLGDSDELAAELMQAAQARGRERWKAQNPGRDTYPGAAELTCWLLSDMDSTLAERDKLKAERDKFREDLEAEQERHYEETLLRGRVEDERDKLKQEQDDAESRVKDAEQFEEVERANRKHAEARAAKLEAENAKQRAALAFYADEDNWTPKVTEHEGTPMGVDDRGPNFGCPAYNVMDLRTPVVKDEGARARAALEGGGEAMPGWRYRPKSDDYAPGVWMLTHDEAFPATCSKDAWEVERVFVIPERSKEGGDAES